MTDARVHGNVASRALGGMVAARGKPQMKRIALVIVAAALTLPTVASAQAAETTETTAPKPWMIRVRALNLGPANKSDAFTALGTNFGKDAVHVSSKTFPEFDFSYSFSSKWSAELVLTYPQEHDVTLVGVGKIGKVTHLPPSLVAQYHFTVPKCPCEPYIGLGVNYTRITSAHLAVGATKLGIERDSFGCVFNIGADYKIGENLYLNLDYKRANIGFDVRAGSSKLTTADLNPNLISVGLGMRF